MVLGDSDSVEERNEENVSQQMSYARFRAGGHVGGNSICDFTGFKLHHQGKMAAPLSQASIASLLLKSLALRGKKHNVVYGSKLMSLFNFFNYKTKN